MKTARTCGVVIAAVVAVAGSVAQAGTGRIVVANDEWTLSNTGFSTGGATNATNFTSNVAHWLTGQATGSALIWTNNGYLSGAGASNFTAALTGAGFTPTQSTGAFTAAQLFSSYDMVVVGGFAVNNQVLIDYVNMGGSVYLAGGTATISGPGSSAQNEAAAWNTFLTAFGMKFQSTYNNVSGNIQIANPNLIPTSTVHPIFSGVSQLYQNNGNSIIDVIGPNAKLVLRDGAGGPGLYAVFAVPMPHASGMALAGLGLLGIRRRTR